MVNVRLRRARAAMATVVLLTLPSTLPSFVGVRARPPLGTPCARPLLGTRTVGTAMCDRTAPREEDDPYEWETAQMPSSDYDAVGQSGSIDVRRSGIDAVRQCLRTTKKVLPLLKEIASRDFFSYFAVNLITPCMYYADVGTSCEMDRCEITPVRDRDVPSKLLDRDLHEYGFTIDGWCRKDMPSDFTEYFDLRTCASRDTGYDGSRVWRFIHTKICFTKRLDEPGMSWKRDYNRAVSGMHAAVNAEIV